MASGAKGRAFESRRACQLTIARCVPTQMTTDNDKLMRLHTGALYTYDTLGRITGCNQFNGGTIPRLHIARTDTASFCVFRRDVPQELIHAIEPLVAKEPPLGGPRVLPKFYRNYVECLSRHRPIEAIDRGPTFRFVSLARADDPRVVNIDRSNKGVFERHMADWLEDVAHRRPFVALVDEGHAVAVCASARMTFEAHEAGVETVPKYRRKGYAARVVAAWARAVQRNNAVPLYSTSWDNRASQAVARALELDLVGTDFQIR